MKIFIAILAVVIIVFLMLGVWFVRWANRPDNVERFRQKKEADTAKKIEGENKEAELAKDFEAKKANLKLVIDEHFSGNRFEFLDFQYEKINYFSFGENELKFSGIITKGQGAQEYFIYSKEDFEDFAAEMEFGVWGKEAYTGIFWDAEPQKYNYPEEYQAAF
jgi:hypothetical protein